MARQRLGAETLDGVSISTVAGDVNDLSRLDGPAAFVLLYGILEYVRPERLAIVLDAAITALLPGGYLFVVTLVDGPDVWRHDREPLRAPGILTAHFNGDPRIERMEERVVDLVDDHDLGRGYAEKHRHAVFRGFYRRRG